MRSYIAAAVLIFCSVALVSAQKTRLGQGAPKAGVDYPIKIHISGIHLRSHCSSSVLVRGAYCEDALYADAILDGQKVELMGYLIWPTDQPIPLIPGDYQARLKGSHPAGAIPISEKYELVLPDRTLWQCTVTGIAE
jgi:hypothetical protein